MKRLFLAIAAVLAFVPAAQACHYGAGFSYGGFASFAAPYVPTVAVQVYAPPVLLAPQVYASPAYAPAAFAAPAYAPACGVEASFGAVGYSPGFAAAPVYGAGYGYGGAAFGVGGVGYGGYGRAFGVGGVNYGVGGVGYGVGVNRGFVVRQRSFVGVGRGIGVGRVGFGAGIGARAFVGVNRGVVVAPRVSTVVRTRSVTRIR